MKMWRPNHSGTFANRVNVHDKNDKKLFVIEFYVDDPKERKSILDLIVNSPELLSEMMRYREILERIEDDPRIWIPSTNGTGIATLDGYINAINKSLGL